ncbi:MAG: hypothetical protein WDL87_02225 [Candidatus Omnitrophota bacterium]|jgi:hypothetical protein
MDLEKNNKFWAIRESYGKKEYYFQATFQGLILTTGITDIIPCQVGIKRVILV